MVTDLPANSFIHLGLHSEYSLHDSLIRIPRLMQRLVELGMPAVALTDYCNLFAMVKFYRAAIKHGIKPIIGAELWITDEAEQQSSGYKLPLLCQDHAGYLNLCRLLTLAYRSSTARDRVNITHAQLFEHHQGLIALSGGMDGDIGQKLLASQADHAGQLLDTYRRYFDDRFVLQLSRTGRPRENEYANRLLTLAADMSCPVIATNEVRFLRAEQFQAHEARVCIHQGRLLDDNRRPKNYTPQQYLRSGDEMAEVFADLPQVLANTVAVAQRCNLEIKFGEYVLPAFPEAGEDSGNEESYLEKAALDGLKQRLKIHGEAPGYSEQDYTDRLHHELKVINQMGFPGYFLVVADFVRWAKRNDIPVGPGRGSGAGSVVAWVLNITDLDPLQYELLFERFLNPERVSMPDFDIDFCMEQRDQVIEYVADTYGHDQVSQIITFGKMNAKAVVRDTGRVLGHGYGFVDSIAKLIPPALDMTLTKALAEEPQLKQRYEEEEEVRGILDQALELEGLTRNAGKHAGGVVIAPGPLTDFTALYNEPGASAVSQLDKDDVEAIGLVKFDFLGLRTLTLIHWAMQTINADRRQQNQEALDLDKIPLDDPASFRLLCACQTTAVFQLESRGMKDLIRRLQPDSFADIVALVALFRPGPLESGMVGDYIDRKHGRSPVAYPHPALEPILKPTYGVILYQEQVMQIAQVLAGYSLGAADLLRRAMGKKKPAEMAKQRVIFVEGSEKNDVDPGLANRIFDLMETFAGYGFNKSHSVAYALLAYQTAYLKAHYPAEFMAAVLSADMDDSDKIANLIDDCRLLGLEVLPPDIHCSSYKFKVEDRAIRFGLGAIKGVGQAAIEAIIDSREQHGAQTGLTEFCCQLDLRKVNRRTMEALIKAGAMTALDNNQAQLMAELDSAVHAAEQVQKDRESGQTGLFGGLAEAPASSAPATISKIPSQQYWTEAQRLSAERETLGLYLTGHPLDEHREEINQFISCPLRKLDARVSNDKKQNLKDAVICALIMAVRRRPGRGAFIAVDDGTGRLEVAVFEEVFNKIADHLVRDQIIVITGDVGVDKFSGGYRMVAKNVMDLNQARNHFVKALHLDISDPPADFDRQLKATLIPYLNGKAEIVADVARAGINVRLHFGADWRVKPSAEMVAALNNLDVVNSVSLKF